MRKKLLLSYILDKISAFVCYLVPPKSNLVVFSQVGDSYADNSRALFESMSNAGYTVRWLCQSIPAAAPYEIQPKFIQRRSLKGLLVALRARVAVVSHGLHDFGALSSLVRHRKVVMLWHGIGIKNLGILDLKVNYTQVTYNTRCYDAIIATSEVDRYYNAAHSNVPVEKVVITGMPRNDRLIAMHSEYSDKKEYRKTSNATVLYAPTFRDYEIGGKSLFFPFPDYNEEFLVESLRKHRIVLLLRPHKNDVASINLCQRLSRQYADIFEFSNPKEEADTASLIARSSAIISDYSSIYLDFVLLDKPCLFIPFDFSYYTARRGIAYDYDLITPGPKIELLSELVEKLSYLSIDDDEFWKERRRVVRKIFHRYTDSKNSERVSLVIKDFFGKSG